MQSFTIRKRQALWPSLAIVHTMQVKTNIEDFDMTAEEAVKSAVDEFTLQGYDLSCVVKTAAGGELAQ